MVYNSETESEEGDPRQKVGSRFSSYTNSNKPSSNKEEIIHHENNEDSGQ